MAEQYLYGGVWSELHNCVFLIGQGIDESPELEHTLVYFNTGKDWKLDVLLKWDSVAISTDLNGEIIIIGVDGEYAIKNYDSYVEGGISDFPTLASAHRTDELLFTVGLSSKIYRYAGSGLWERDVDGIREGHDFVGIGGKGNNIFVVGDKGICYRRFGDAWKEEFLPTNEYLISVDCSDDGVVIICGRNGMLLVGGYEEWEILEHDFILDDFWSVKYLKGRFLVAGNNCIYELSFKEQWALQPLYGWEIANNGIFSDMFFEGGERQRFWVVSEKGLAFEDGEGWTRLY